MKDSEAPRILLKVDIEKNELAFKREKIEKQMNLSREKILHEQKKEKGETRE